MTGGKDKLMAMLRRAGLHVAGDWKTEEVLPPRAAWRSVVAGEARPTVSVRADRPDVVAELNAQWHRLATESGIFGKDGVFLIDVGGGRAGCGQGVGHGCSSRISGTSPEFWESGPGSRSSSPSRWTGTHCWG